MSDIYFYKLTADNGGAPCVRHGLLSLAICKPMIRKTAEEGDLTFGFAANSLHRDNRLLYVARVTKKLADGEYYRNG
jgi:Nucleotide modification associated domain 2